MYARRLATHARADVSAFKPALTRFLKTYRGRVRQLIVYLHSYAAAVIAASFSTTP